MKFKSLPVILAILALSTLSCSLTAGFDSQPESMTTPPDVPQTSQLWHNIPIYPGASLRDEPVSDSAIGALYETTEARLYETADGFEQVDAFYQAEMPNHGWQELQHACRDDLCLSSWFAGDGDIYVQVGISADEGGGALVGLVWGQGRK